MHETERGSFDLHRGRPLLVSGPPGSSTAAALVASVEGLTPQTLEKLRVMSPGVVRLAVRRPQTHRYNGLGKGRNNRPQVISLPVPDVVSPAELWKLASTVGSGSVFAPGARAASGPEIAGLTLTRWGDLLPAVVSVTVDDPKQELLTGELKSGAILTVTTQQVEAMASAEHPELTEVSVGPVPLGDAENALFVSFRETTGNTGHVAVLIGNQEEWPDPPSACTRLVWPAMCSGLGLFWPAMCSGAVVVTAAISFDRAFKRSPPTVAVCCSIWDKRGGGSPWRARCVRTRCSRLD